MTAGTPLLTSRPEWSALEAHHRQVRDLHLRTLFAEDPRRGERLKAEAVGLYLESETEPKLGHDSSTNCLIRRYRTLRGR
jgi:hypothetical protein